jgi:hypothetical protein
MVRQPKAPGETPGAFFMTWVLDLLSLFYIA